MAGIERQFVFVFITYGGVMEYKTTISIPFYTSLTIICYDVFILFYL